MVVPLAGRASTARPPTASSQVRRTAADRGARGRSSTCSRCCPPIRPVAPAEGAHQRRLPRPARGRRRPASCRPAPRAGAPQTVPLSSLKLEPSSEREASRRRSGSTPATDPARRKVDARGAGRSQKSSAHRCLRPVPPPTAGDPEATLGRRQPTRRARGCAARSARAGARPTHEPELRSEDCIARDRCGRALSPSARPSPAPSRSASVDAFAWRSRPLAPGAGPPRSSPDRAGRATDVTTEPSAVAARRVHWPGSADPPMRPPEAALEPSHAQRTARSSSWRRTGGSARRRLARSSWPSPSRCGLLTGRHAPRALA